MTANILFLLKEFERSIILALAKIEGEMIPLFDVDEDGGEAKETKKIIPIYAEQILVSKKIVQIGEVVISKRSVTENRDIRIDTIKEEVTIGEPNE